MPIQPAGYPAHSERTGPTSNVRQHRAPSRDLPPPRPTTLPRQTQEGLRTDGTEERLRRAGVAVSECGGESVPGLARLQAQAVRVRGAPEMIRGLTTVHLNRIPVLA